MLEVIPAGNMSKPTLCPHPAHTPTAIVFQLLSSVSVNIIRCDFGLIWKQGTVLWSSAHPSPHGQLCYGDHLILLSTHLPHSPPPSCVKLIQNVILSFWSCWSLAHRNSCSIGHIAGTRGCCWVLLQVLQTLVDPNKMNWAKGEIHPSAFPLERNNTGCQHLQVCDLGPTAYWEQKTRFLKNPGWLIHPHIPHPYSQVMKRTCIYLIPTLDLNQ